MGFDLGTRARARACVSMCVCAPPTPTMAATEESASERWWKALATSVGAAVRVPTAWVMRKSHSFLVGVGCGAG